MKTSVCSASKSTTLATKADAAVDFEVTTMTYEDQCAYTVTASCDLPKVTLTTATGGFLSANKKVGVSFIEGTTETLGTLKYPWKMGDSASLGEQGSFYPVWNEGVSSEVVASDLEKSMNYYLSWWVENNSRIVDFAGQVAANKKYNDMIKKYNSQRTTFLSDFSAFQAQIVKKAK